MEKERLKKVQSALAETVRTLRKAQGYSQSEFALVADITQSYLSRVERGIVNPQLDILAKLATGFNISLDQLFQFDAKAFSPAEYTPEMKGARIVEAVKELPLDVRVKLHDALTAHLIRK